MNIRERIENNLTIVLLSILLTGFLAGIGTYQGIIEIAKLKVVPASEINNKIDTRSLFRGAFNLGNAYTWATSKQYKGATDNYVWAHKALTNSKAFSDMSLANSVMDNINLSSNNDPKVLEQNILSVYENLSGQATNKK